MDALRQFALFLLFSAVMMGAVTFVLPHGRLTETAKSVLTVTLFFAVLQFLPAFRLRLPVPASAGGYDADDFSAAAEVAGAAAERLMNGVLAERLKTVTDAPYTASFALHIDGDCVSVRRGGRRKRGDGRARAVWGGGRGEDRGQAVNQKEQIRGLFQKLKTDKRALLVPCLACVGALLLLLSAGGEKAAKKTAETPVQQIEQAETRLEERLTKLLSGVDGVGKLRVIVTLDSMEAYVYARDTGADINGGTRESVVLVGDSGGKEGLPEKLIAPSVRGVAVACEGGGSAAVRREVTALVGAALGVSANRIHVSRMEK